MENLPLSSVFDRTVPVPAEGEEITAKAQGVGQGPVRPGFLQLLSNIWSIVQGKVFLRGVAVGLTGGAGNPANPAEGTIEAIKGIYSTLGPIEALGGNVIASSPNPAEGNVVASWDVVAGQNVRTVGIKVHGGGGHFESIGGEGGAAISFTSVGTAGNPPFNATRPNCLLPAGLIKAWAYVLTNAGGGFTILTQTGSSFAIKGATLNAGPNYIEFEMTSPMTDNKYGVMAFGSHAFTEGYSAKTTTTFRILCPVDPTATTVALTVLALGHHAT